MKIRYELRDDDDCSWMERSILWKIEDGVESEFAYDGGEPEDNSFDRDLGIYVVELNRLAEIISNTYSDGS